VNNIGNYVCVCNEGFVRSGSNCIDKDECALGIDNCNRDSELCQNTEGSYTCDSCAVDPTAAGCSSIAPTLLHSSVPSEPSSGPSNFPSGSPSTSKPTSPPIDCVSSDFELRTRIAFASEDPTTPTSILICSDIVLSQEIIVTEKAFDLYCVSSDEFCQLDAQNSNRIFIGAPKQVSFNAIDFVNGKVEEDNGGAIYLEGSGTVWFQGSRFFNNRAQRGGAMYINGPLELTIINCLFQLNQATVVGLLKVQE